MASSGCGSGFQQGCVCVVMTIIGCSRVQVRRDKGKIKMRWFFFFFLP